jgi:F-type H+-transporting ATPase subunit epsilon
MKGFRMMLRDNSRSQVIEGVVSFVGEDASGSFGILADHARVLTSLVFGLARFRTDSGPWQYLAMPGAILGFDGNVLTLNTRRYLLGENYEDMSRALTEKLAEEEQSLSEIKRTLHHIETNVLKQMLEMNKAGARFHE